MFIYDFTIQNCHNYFCVQQLFGFCHINIPVEDDEVGALAGFERAGFATLDLTDDELAKEHVRHMVGGRSVLARDERLFRFEFPERPGALMRFLAQMKEPLVLVLIGAGMVTAGLGEWIDSSVIFGVVVVNAIIGYLQEGKAEAALAALARAVATDVTVVRGGRRRRMDAVHLVPGDVVWLSAGDKVPADLRIVSGRTESHLMLVDLRAKNLTGKAAEALLGRAHITVNKNSVPNDPQSPFVTSGIRVGTPAATTRGFGVDDMKQIARWIDRAVRNVENESELATIKAEVLESCNKHPLYPGLE